MFALRPVNYPKDMPFCVQRLIEMPEKAASLYFCNRDEFFESRGCLNFYGATA
ncbi:hypothetical protein [Psychrobacter sp. AOP7-A1-24]|uniref:hypothetical protein n=1 Tax=Psychrobacter sp. AOP7-A1-24 TaxID=3457646 RepID=UPI00402B3C2E